MTRAALYLRISDDRKGTGLGVERQRRDCERFCAERGWTVTATFADNDVSAYTGKVRPQYERMLEAMKQGEVDAVVAWHPDRLHRRPMELERFINLVDATGVTVATVMAGYYDLTTATGRMTARVVGAMDAAESERKSERTKRKHLELLEAGAVVGGGRPFGYEDDRRTVRADEAVLIREAAEAVLAGETLRSIARRWRDAGVIGPKGNPLSPKSLRRILTSPRIAGRRIHGGTDVRAVWPAVVDEETSRRLRAVLLDPARTAHVNWQARSYPLTGFLLCGRCGRRLIAQPRRDRRRSYCCSSAPERGGCGGIRIVAEPLEAEVLARLLAVVDAEALADAVAGARPDDRPFLEAIEEAEVSLAQLSRDHYADRLIGRAEYLAAHQALAAKIDQARRRLRAHQRDERRRSIAGAGSASLAGSWEGLTLDQQRAVLGAFVAEISIGPAVKGVNRFDPARVAVSWRV